MFKETMPQPQKTNINIEEEERRKEEIEKRREELYTGKPLTTESIAVVKPLGKRSLDIEAFQKAQLDYLKNQEKYLAEHGGKKPELKDFPMKTEVKTEVKTEEEELALEELKKLKEARAKIQEFKGE